MRTVTFSDEKVAELVNDNFVSTWYNRNPSFHNCDLGEEERIFKTAFDCYATRNFCTFFVTPKREVLHYFAGYYSPALFREELNFVLRLAKETLDGNGNLKRGWVRPFRKLHGERVEKRKADASKIAGMKINTSRNQRSSDNAVSSGDLADRKGSLVEGLQYLRQVHRWFRGKTHSGRKVYLQQVLHGYSGGNLFSEE
jgi:hypothetical protein